MRIQKLLQSINRKIFQEPPLLFLIKDQFQILRTLYRGLWEKTWTYMNIVIRLVHVQPMKYPGVHMHLDPSPQERWYDKCFILYYIFFSREER